MHSTLWVSAAALLLLVIAVASASEDRHHGDHHKTKEDHHGKHDDHHGRADHHGRGDHHGRSSDHHGSSTEHHGKASEHHGKAAEHHEEEVADTPEEKKALEEEHDEEQEKLIARLDHLTARLHVIDEELEKRLDPELKIKAQSLLHRLENLEPDTCEKEEYQCGGFEPECIGRLFVCDGTKDCHNGDDEDHCDLPTSKGDTFVGHVVFDHCSQRKPENMSFTITAVKENKAFTAIVKLRAEIHISHEDDTVEGEVVLPTVGYYRFSSQNLVLLPPEDDRLGLICDFDGSNPDRCVGNIVRESSLEPCAQFIFHREEYDDEHEHENHH